MKTKKVYNFIKQTQRSFIGLLLAWDLCLCRGLSVDHRRSDLIAEKLGRASSIREWIEKP